jgi:spore coat protein CotH
MDKFEKTIFAALIVLAVVLVGLLVYYHKELMQPTPAADPLPDDHVAKILIVMSEDNWQQLKTNAMAKPIVRADFWFDGEPYKNVAVRTKGMNSLMTSQGSARLPLKVDFNFFVSAQKFRGIKKLCLNNGVSDPSFIREVLGYELFEKMNLPTPRRAFADVWINDIHLGLYTIVEGVDKTFLRRNFRNAEGNLYKPETPAATLNWTRDDLSKQNTGLSQSSDKNKTNNLDIKIGGSRLGDLIKILKQEGAPGSEMLPNDTTASTGQGGFRAGPGGQFPGGPRGQFPGEPNRPFFAGPEGQFPDDPNRPFPGQFAEDGPGGRSGGDPNRFFPDGPGRQFPGEPNESFNGGFRARGGFPGGPGRGFAGDPNRSFDGGFRGRRDFRGDPNRPFGRGERGRFGGGPGGRGGPGGPFGRGGNLLEQMGLKTNENYPDYSGLLNFLEVLNNCPDESFPKEIEKVLDVDAFLRFLAVSVLTVHLDNYIGMGHNYYLYEDNGKFTVIPWDLNLAFGTFGGGPGGGGPGGGGPGRRAGGGGPGGGSSVDFYIDSPVSGNMAEKPLVWRILAYKPYMDKYHQYLKQLLDGPFAEGVIEARIDELSRLVRPYVEADDLKFSTKEDFERSVSDNPASGDNEQTGFNRRSGRGGFGFGGPGGRGGGGMNAPLLRTFIKQRRISVKEQLDGTRASRAQDSQNAGSTNMFDPFGGSEEQPE